MSPPRACMGAQPLRLDRSPHDSLANMPPAIQLQARQISQAGRWKTLSRALQPLSLYHTQLTAHLGKRRDRLVDMVQLVCGRHLGADTGGAFWYDREGETDDVNAFLQHPVGELF